MATNYIRDRELRRLQWCVTQEFRKQSQSDAVARYLAAKVAA